MDKISYEAQVQVNKQLIKKLNAEIEALRQKKNKLEIKVESLQNSYNTISDSLVDLDNRIAIKNKELIDITKKCDDDCISIKVLEDKATAKEKSLNEREVGIEKLEEIAKNKAKHYDDKCNELAVAKKAITEDKKSAENVLKQAELDNKEVKKLIEKSRKDNFKLEQLQKEYELKISANEKIMNEYDVMIQEQKKEATRFSLLSKNLNKEKEELSERKVKLGVLESGVIEKEKIANSLKLSFERQIEALNEKETKLEIFKLKLNKAAEKQKLEKELEGLKEL